MGDARPAVDPLPRVLLCAALVVIIAMGIRATTGLMLQPMTEARGWSREAYSFAFALQNLVWGLAVPFFGYVSDRFGSGRTIATGGVLYAIGLVVMRYVETPLGLDLASGVLIGLGLSGTSFSIVLGVVARHAPPAKRSAALGIAAAGGSMGQFIMLPIGQQFLTAFEWHGALFAFALIAALIVPVAAGLQGRGDDTGAVQQQSAREALREAGRHASFHFLFWSFFTCGFHTAFVLLHFPAYVMGSGLPLHVGVTAIALIGLFNVIGTYASGLLGGRYPKRKLLAYIYLGRAAVMAVFLAVPMTPATVYVFAVTIGLLWLGTVPLTNGLVAYIYGTRYVSMLGGIIFLGHQIGSFLGAWLGGYAFDRFGSYDLIWILSVAVGVTAGLLSWPVDERPISRPLQRSSVGAVVPGDGRP